MLKPVDHATPPCTGTVIPSEFIPPWWAKNRHVQTIYPRFFQKRKPVQITWETLDVPHSDVVEIAWGPKITHPKGLVVMFHGLEGCVRSHYANDMIAVLAASGWNTVMMHFRGCTGKPNLTTRAYHSGDTADALLFLHKLNKEHPDLPKVAFGVSLGANMLLKLLGENPNSHGLQAAVAVSAPLKLNECSNSVNKGFSRIYQKHLLKSMKRNLKRKMGIIDYSKDLKITPDQVDSIQSFREFDNKITAPLHGFEDAKDYYNKCSGFPFLNKITCPTLIIHAKDDPFMNHNVIPQQSDLAESVCVELSNNGGHVGFLHGTPWQPKIWLHQRIPQYFNQIIQKSSAT